MDVKEDECDLRILVVVRDGLRIMHKIMRIVSLPSWIEGLKAFQGVERTRTLAQLSAAHYE